MYQYKREPLTIENMNRLANAAETGIEKTVVFALMDTGLRVNEFSTLTKESMLWQERRLRIFGKGGPYGKKTKRRIVPLTERAFTVLSHYFSLNDSIGYTDRGLQKLIRRVAVRAGITQKVCPHVLRHTFAVNCLRNGLSTRYIQEIMGHDHLSTTEIYLNVSPEEACAEFHKRLS